MRSRVVVLVSGTGTLLQALLDATAAADPAAGATAGSDGVSEQAELGASHAPTPGEADDDPRTGVEVVAVLSDRSDAAGLERARAAGVPAEVVAFDPARHRGAGRADWDRKLAERIAAHRPDFVVSAGFMRLLGPAVLAHHTVVNSHPALLPAFPGAHAVRDALAYGVRVTGCTVHLVDDGVDTGPVLAQAAVEVLPEDDEASLHERIKSVERPLLVDVVTRMARSGWTIAGRKVTIP
ncbi:MAG: phosphoribosylglycinamide formyltransferase [Motilibacteraceae bacterium]